jgi:hypothetical protein
MSYVLSATDIHASVTAARRSLDRGELDDALAHLERATGGLRVLGRTTGDEHAFRAFAGLEAALVTAENAVGSRSAGADRELRGAVRATDHLLWALADGAGLDPTTQV